MIASVPADREGIDCARDDDACGVPVNTEIRLVLDRPLLPKSGVRQALRVYTGAASNAAPLASPRYDVLTRELVFRFQAPLAPKALYRAELLIPSEAQPFGLRAFDGAPLAPQAVPLEWSFFTAGPDVRAPEPALPAIEPTCDDITALFRSKCAEGCCHGAAEPPLGLRLGSREDVSRTIGRVARQTDLGTTLGAVNEDPARFGTGMPLISAGSAATSYLVYKLLLNPANLGPCEVECDTFGALPGAESCHPLSDAEQRRLREWFVRGEPMPLNRGRTVDGVCRNVAVERHLDCSSLRAITRFIDSGARCD